MDDKAKLEAVNFFFQSHSRSTRNCHEASETCNEPAICAHSIPSSTVLKRLSRNGHVVMPHISLKYPPPAEISFKAIGISSATTFTGLCSQHDNDIFRLIDTTLPNIKDDTHLFLLAYRAVLREFHVVLQNGLRFQATYQKRVDLGISPGAVPCQYGLFAASHLENAYDCYSYKRQFDVAYLNKRWDDVTHEILFLADQGPTIAVSSLFSLDDVPAPEVPRVALSLFPNDDGVVVVFSSTKDDSPYVRDYIKRILDADSYYRRYLISKLVLQSCDNFVISPEYFDQMSNSQKDAICRFYVDTILENHEEHDDKNLYLF